MEEDFGTNFIFYSSNTFFVFAPNSQENLDFNVKMNKNQAISEAKKLAEKECLEK